MKEDKHLHAPELRVNKQNPGKGMQKVPVDGHKKQPLGLLAPLIPGVPFTNGSTHLPPRKRTLNQGDGKNASILCRAMGPAWAGRCSPWLSRHLCVLAMPGNPIFQK